MSHIVLLGDSIFDNERYVPGKPPVIEQLCTWLPKGWRATLLARDGAGAGDVPKQLAQLPADATHLVISAGGNNALENSQVVLDTSHTAAEGFQYVAEIQQQFRQEYKDMLRAVLAIGKPTVLCTIYDSLPEFPAATITALSVFNDVILREGFTRGLPILDLRLICTEARDYSNCIEPSEAGGAKIVRGICRVVTGHDFSTLQSVIYHS